MCREREVVLGALVISMDVQSHMPQTYSTTSLTRKGFG